MEPKIGALSDRETSTKDLAVYSGTSLQYSELFLGWTILGGPLEVILNCFEIGTISLQGTNSLAP